MKHGLFGVGSGICADPAVGMRVAQAAEQAGLESVWTGEHVVLPDPRTAPSPADPDFPMLHPSAVLAYIAAGTRTIKLGTGIVLIAQRNPVVLAKEIASLDVLCAGRLLFGVGAGYLHQEFAALGIPFEQRGARTDEYIDAMRELWTSDKPRFNGRFVKFAGIQARPRPVQAGGPHLLVGGSSETAYRRAVTKCQGWYGFALDVPGLRRSLEGLARAARALPRPADLGRLEISVTPRAVPDAALSEQFAQLGVDRLIWLMPQTEADILRMIERIAALPAA